MLRIAQLDHIVLNVADVERSLAFYCDILGLAAVRVDEYRAGTVGFPSVRVSSDTIIDLSQRKAGEAPPTGQARNLNHFCLVWERDGVRATIDYLRANGIEIERPPTHAWGARGRGTSIRVQDPDGNVVELRTYGAPDEADF
jgi:catechol 2,3-dioxygenase-like lactoylglutathione lyase family enzyme